MAFPQVHVLTVMGGSLFGTEQWSCSFRSTMLPQTEATTPAVAAAIEDWFTGGVQVMGNQARLGFVKHNVIGLTGRYLEDITQEVRYEPEVIRSSGASNQAPQVSLVATLETGVTRGLAHRGRMFLPAPLGIPGADGRLPAGSASAVATSLADLFTTLNGLPEFGTAVVMSDVREGAVRPITGVSVGRVMDTMRSRRAQLSEERPATAPVAGT